MTPGRKKCGKDNKQGKHRDWHEDIDCTAYDLVNQPAVIPDNDANTRADKYREQRGKKPKKECYAGPIDELGKDILTDIICPENVPVIRGLERFSGDCGRSQGSDQRGGKCDPDVNAQDGDTHP